MFEFNTSALMEKAQKALPSHFKFEQTFVFLLFIFFGHQCLGADTGSAVSKPHWVCHWKQKFIDDNHLNMMDVQEFFFTCRVMMVIELLLVFHQYQIQLLREQFSRGSVLFSKMVLLSFGTMLHCICNGSGSQNFNISNVLGLKVLSFSLVII